jgi:hypothetical protein
MPLWIGPDIWTDLHFLTTDQRIDCLRRLTTQPSPVVAMWPLCSTSPAGVSLSAK